MSDNLVDEVKRIYELFYKKLSGTDHFILSLSQKETVLINNFLELIENKFNSKGIGIHFIFDYFIFQFDYWITKETRFGKKIPLSWFIGKKAFDRWLKRPEYDLWHAKQTAAQYGIHISLIQKQREVLDIKKINESEEIEKKRFYNTLEGLVNCQETTTLYNHRSSLCLMCCWKGDCKDLLKAEYLKFYILRGYLRNEQNTFKKQKTAPI